MILTNLHMVDIPYARKVSCARESKVIEVTHTLLHLSLAHMDELDSRACICASFCKVLCSPHNCLPAHHFGPSSKPFAAPFPWKVANWSCSCCRCISSFSLDSLHTRSRSPSPSSWRHTWPPSQPQTLVFWLSQPSQFNLF